MSLNEALTVEQAAFLLKAGKLVALPTETVYGLAANAFDPIAVAKIFAAKDRPFFDPLIVHVADFDWLPRVVREFPPLAARLAERFWPGPLTLVVPKNDAIPDLVTSGLSNVGVRLPDHELMRQVLRKAGIPVAAPSANPFGRLSPTTAEHVRSQIGHRIDGILDGGTCRVGIESTILQVEGNRVTMLRPGGVALEEIERLVGKVEHPAVTSAESPAAPGMLASHYSPRTPLIVVDAIPSTPPWPRTGLLCLQMPEEVAAYSNVEVLSGERDLVIAAANFFQGLHRLDAAGLDGIIAVRFSPQGLGRALNDRLTRAAHGTKNRAGEQTSSNR